MSFGVDQHYIINKRKLNGYFIDKLYENVNEEINKRKIVQNGNYSFPPHDEP